MNQSLKSVLQFAVFILFGCSINVWLAADGDSWIWFCRIVLPVPIVVIIRKLRQAAKKPDLAVDHLHERFGTSFERDGMCFYPLLSVEPARFLCWFEIYFQNRYEGPCRFQVKFEPSCKAYSFARHEVPKVEVAVDCPGGAGGVIRMPYPIPSKYQGKRIQYEVTARTKYPGKAGKILRHTEGVRVGALRSDLDPVGCLIGIFLALTLVIYLPTRLFLDLPEWVTDKTPPDTGMETLILWDADPARKCRSVDQSESTT